MIRIIVPPVLLLLSAIIIMLSLELKSWSDSIASNDAQNFIKVKNTQLDIDLWEKYLSHKLDLNMVTPSIFEVELTNVSDNELSILLDKFQNLRYARLYRLDIVANQMDQMFKISAVMTLD